MQPITKSIIHKEIASFKPIDQWSIDSFFQDALSYIRGRCDSKNIGLEEAQELRRDLQTLARWNITRNQKDAWIVQKYALKSYAYKIKIYDMAISDDQSC